MGSFFGQLSSLPQKLVENVWRAAFIEQKRKKERKKEEKSIFGRPHFLESVQLYSVLRNVTNPHYL